MIKLSKVTLCTISCTHYNETLKAIRESIKEIEFAKIRIITDNASWIKNIPNCEVFIIPALSTLESYSQFIIKNLNDYIDTDYVLIIQWDGFIKNPKAWTNEFLEYDYIGAPWAYRDEYSVGNGGFSLRSKKLLETVQKADFIEVTYPEDHVICRTYGNQLRELGIKFAPEELAARFSIEGYKNSKYGANYTNQFGFHDFKITYFPEESRHLVKLSSLEIENIKKYLTLNSVVLGIETYENAVYFSYFVHYYYSIEFDISHSKKIEDLLFSRENIISRMFYDIKECDNFIKLFGEKFNIVLINGKWLNTIKNIEILFNINKDAIILIYNWNSKQQDILSYYSIIEYFNQKNNNLIVLKRK